jgi:dCMP deaminase
VAMMSKIDNAHMKAAEAYAELSHAIRLKVGAIVTKDDRVISIGYNGTPAGWDNKCEDEIKWPNGEVKFTTTKPEVLHAEANAIGKLARSLESGEGAIMYITHAPCFECSKMIHVAGINKVFYRNQYRNDDGIKFLNQCKIEVEQI